MWDNEQDQGSSEPIRIVKKFNLLFVIQLKVDTIGKIIYVFTQIRAVGKNSNRKYLKGYTYRNQLLKN